MSNLCKTAKNISRSFRCFCAVSPSAGFDCILGRRMTFQMSFVDFLLILLILLYFGQIILIFGLIIGQITEVYIQKRSFHILILLHIILYHVHNFRFGEEILLIQRGTVDSSWEFFLLMRKVLFGFIFTLSLVSNVKIILFVFLPLLLPVSFTPAMDVAMSFIQIVRLLSLLIVLLCAVVVIFLDKLFFNLFGLVYPPTLFERPHH